MYVLLVIYIACSVLSFRYIRAKGSYQCFILVVTFEFMDIFYPIFQKKNFTVNTIIQTNGSIKC